MRMTGRALLVLSLSALLLVPVGALTTVVVTVSGDTAAGENQPGWMFNRDTSTSTPFEFNTGAASIGSGSLYVLPISSVPADKFIGEFFMLRPIADIDAIAYDFRIGSGGDPGDASQFYMSVYANFGSSSPTKFYDCRYSVVPAAGSQTEFTTVTFHPWAAYPVRAGSGVSSCPAMPAGMGPGATLRVFALNVGDTSASDAVLDGYLDNVVVSLRDGTSTTYDFEPAGPQTADDCKDGGWRAYGFPNQGQCIKSVQADEHAGHHGWAAHGEDHGRRHGLGHAGHKGGQDRHHKGR
ncbi:MAG: hypothetical protein AB7H88_12225 [Vicinamibacterales bacterium]